MKRRTVIRRAYFKGAADTEPLWIEREYLDESSGEWKPEVYAIAEGVVVKNEHAGLYNGVYKVFPGDESSSPLCFVNLQVLQVEAGV
jgi:hypothetical protein